MTTELEKSRSEDGKGLRETEDLTGREEGKGKTMIWILGVSC